MYDGSVITVVDMVETMMFAVEIQDRGRVEKEFGSSSVSCVDTTPIIRSNIDCRN